MLARIAVLLGLWLVATPVLATPQAFTATQEIRFASLGVSFSVGGVGVADVNTGVSPVSFDLPASVFSFGSSAATGSGNTLAISASNGAGVFASGGGGFGGIMRLIGTLSLGFPVTVTTSTVSGGTTTTTTLLTLLFDATVLGGPGSVTATTSTGGNSFSGTLVGGAFGTGTVAGVAGFDNRVGAIGNLQMVAPVSIISGVLPGGRADGVIILNVTFVPEPSTGALFGLGAIGFGLIGRRQQRARG